MVLRHFLPKEQYMYVVQGTHFHGFLPQSLDYSTVQDSALRYSHQGAVQPSGCSTAIRVQHRAIRMQYSHQGAAQPSGSTAIRVQHSHQGAAQPSGCSTGPSGCSTAIRVQHSHQAAQNMHVRACNRTYVCAIART